jgi:SAM-dependent methyltransferase
MGSNIMEKRYTHTEEMHNLQAPLEIVPLLVDLLHPSFVIDVGCGTGTFMRVFKQHGVKVLGIDGAWCNRELLFKNIEPEEFVERDLEQRLGIEHRADLVVCLEVAEHLSAERADSFVEDLTAMADVVLFSAAVPGQGGDHHLNEQWLPYWVEKFSARGFECYDVMRSRIWDNEKVFWWYRQNMVLFAKDEAFSASPASAGLWAPGRVIHPELFRQFADFRSRHAIKRYATLLAKALLHRIGLMR